MKIQRNLEGLTLDELSIFAWHRFYTINYEKVEDNKRNCKKMLLKFSVFFNFKTHFACYLFHFVMFSFHGSRRNSIFRHGKGLMQECDTDPPPWVFKILLRHLLEGLCEIEVRMRTLVFKEYGQYLSSQVNTGRAKVGTSSPRWRWKIAIKLRLPSKSCLIF